MENLKDRFLNLYRNVSNVLRKPVVSVLPGHLSFFLLLSSLPILLLVGVIANTFSLSYSKITEFITLSLPANVSKLLLPLFNTKAPDISIILLVITTLFLASRATKAIISTSNNIYGIRRNYLQDMIKSFFITIILILLIMFIVIILILGGKIIGLLGRIPEISSFSKYLESIRIFRWPFSFFVIFISIKIIYTLTPNKKIKSKSVNKGSMFTTVLWFLITFIYSFYVTHYATYNTFYGSASNILILMLWIYIISTIFVVGMIINSIEDKK